MPFNKYILFFIFLSIGALSIWLPIRSSKSINNYSPSFDCEAVKKGSVKKKICTNEELASLDVELSAVYSGFYFLSKEIKNTQRTWLKVRNECSNDICIRASYVARIKKLKKPLSNQRSFPKYILDAMIMAERSMEMSWDTLPINELEIAQRRKSKVFKEEVFSFQNIFYKKPLIERVQFDDIALNNSLGPCAKYNFDSYIQEYIDKNESENFYYELSPSDRFVTKKIEIFTSKLSFTIWRVFANGKDWFFIKPANERTSAYLVDPNLCDIDEGNNLIAALNRKEIKRARYGAYYPVIVVYKGKDYVFDVFWNETSSIRFTLSEILGPTARFDETIRFIGGWLFTLPFENKTN